MPPSQQLGKSLTWRRYGSEPSSISQAGGSPNIAQTIFPLDLSGG
jgi:hypothetical protein